MDIETHVGPTPASAIDLFGDATLRDMGSAVWLERAGAYFIGRYADVRAALNDWRSFSSDQGIGLNPIINAAWDEALICQDPPVHTERRRLIMEALGPLALKPVADTIATRADALVARIVAMGDFDAVTDLAHDLPVGVVMDLIGWPEDVRPQLLRLAEGSWNAAGPANARMETGLTGLQEMMALLADIYDQNRVTPEGFAAKLIAAAHRGDISRDTAIGMLAGYVVAAFETTISAMAAGIWFFARNPAEWDELRADPRLAMGAANEIVRMETPLQNFARVGDRQGCATRRHNPAARRASHPLLCQRQSGRAPVRAPRRLPHRQTREAKSGFRPWLTWLRRTGVGADGTDRRLHCAGAAHRPLRDCRPARPCAQQYIPRIPTAARPRDPSLRQG